MTTMPPLGNTGEERKSGHSSLWLNACSNFCLHQVVWHGAWTLKPTYLSLSPGSTAYKLHSHGQVTKPLCASISSSMN
jgi:hypothetical protein